MWGEGYPVTTRSFWRNLAIMAITLLVYTVIVLIATQAQKDPQNVSTEAFSTSLPHNPNFQKTDGSEEKNPNMGIFFWGGLHNCDR